MSFATHPATEDRFADLATMLGPKNPAASVCWCLSHRIDAKTNRELVGAARGALRSCRSEHGLRIARFARVLRLTIGLRGLARSVRMPVGGCTVTHGASVVRDRNLSVGEQVELVIC